MLTTTKIFISNSTNPWFNLAYEEELVKEVNENEVYLYLWQNQHTVVIGKHQNPWREVLVSDLEDADGKVARRLSGGGAVYHDLGNLNFTFVMNKKNTDLHKQLKVIVDGVKKLGIDAEFSGRNDILAEGRKFSGNAFYNGKDNYYHHGTILVDVDMTKLGKYLNVSMKKLKAKGVESVKSRVINLKALNSEITIPKMKDAISDAFEVIYGRSSETIFIDEGNASESAKERYNHYASWDWRFGKTPKFDVTFEEKFTWGELVFSFKLKDAIVEESRIYSDAMSTEIIEAFDGLFTGVKFEKTSLIEAVNKVKLHASYKVMLEEVSQWISSLPL